jgi:S-DNA-T family DNA segregation ATPase FtsK/SpoIIIE
MISKILKTQLFLLFIVTIISFLGYYYKEFLPDNYFTISSTTRDVNFLLYYLTSFVALIGYYTGPWIFLPFLFFSLFYSFFYSNRNFKLDIFNVFLLTAIFLLASYLFVPSLLGDGIRYLVSKMFPPLLATLVLAVTAILFWSNTFRKTFISSILNLGSKLKVTPILLLKVFQGMKFSKKTGEVSIKKSSSFKAKINLKISSFLQGEKSISSGKGIRGWLNKKFFNAKIVESKQSNSNFSEAIALPCEEFKTNSNEPSSFSFKDFIKKEKKTSTHEEQDSVPANTVEEYSVPDNLSSLEANDKYFKIIEDGVLKENVSQVSPPTDEYFEQIITRIQDKLCEFKIDGLIVEVLKGPVVDTFLLELGKGIKVSKVYSSADDLSGALYGAPIRIVYPMKGRTTVGIEVPRNPREIIYLHEVLNTKHFQKNNYALPLAMGKDAFGETFVVDLASMPHMLVAGATGAGKSVFINTILVSLLVKRSPTQMKLILIDPKQLELALYAKLPHLALPVVTDAKMASLALLWAVQEMERRYSILREFGVRNLDGFNDKLKDSTPDMLANIKHFYDDENFELPYIVIIVDEFADLILTKAGKEIENNICRLAGKARAAGIHLVLATQRPSVDVITGLIKSNFPTRVSFRVTTGVDSRTILSQSGAEKLLGKGDMLYKRGVETVRVHSSFVDEDEIAAFVKKLSVVGTQFDNNAMDFIENSGEAETDPYAFGSHLSDDSFEEDSLFEKAVEIVQEHRAASASMLQRRLKVGYNRAANLIERMETKGIVGPAQGSKPRKVLASQQGFSSHDETLEPS